LFFAGSFSLDFGVYFDIFKDFWLFVYINAFFLPIALEIGLFTSPSALLLDFFWAFSFLFFKENFQAFFLFYLFAVAR